MVKCDICGKEFSNKGIGSHKWRVHGKGKEFNPNRGYLDGSRQAWNKGLTKETSESVQKYANSLTKPMEDWQSAVDDDRKLYQRWCNKIINAQFEGIRCLLSFQEYCLLVKDAGLVSSQLGYTGENYVLARYNDEGDYTYNNCRFITQKENSDEKVRRLYPGVG